MSDPELPCICAGNWRLIVSEVEGLIGKWFDDPAGGRWYFFGVVHGADDYYYGMSGGGKMRLLSCCGDMASHGLTLSAEAPD